MEAVYPNKFRIPIFGPSKLWGNTTILPNGEVFLSGGRGPARTASEKLDRAVYKGQIWNPQTGRWRDTASAHKKHNLFQHAVFNSAELGDFSTGRAQAYCCVWLNKEEYLLSQQTISETDWRLIMLTPINRVTQQVTKYQQFINNLGVYFVLLTAIFFTLFFAYLNKQADKLATRVSKPVELVTDYISRLNKLGNKKPLRNNNKPLPIMQVGIRELDRLINSC